MLRLLSREQWLLLTDEQRLARAETLRQMVAALQAQHERRFHPPQQWVECSRPGCHRHSRSRGMCPLHYQKHRRHEKGKAA